MRAIRAAEVLDLEFCCQFEHGLPIAVVKQPDMAAMSYLLCRKNRVPQY